MFVVVGSSVGPLAKQINKKTRHAAASLVIADKGDLFSKQRNVVNIKHYISPSIISLLIG